MRSPFDSSAPWAWGMPWTSTDARPDGAFANAENGADALDDVIDAAPPTKRSRDLAREPLDLGAAPVQR